MCVGGTPEVFTKEPISIEHLDPTFTSPWRGERSKMFYHQVCSKQSIAWEIHLYAHCCKEFM